MLIEKPSHTKPLLRGYFHEAAFFLSLGACLMLISQSHGFMKVASSLIYSISLVGLFGVSALYHRPTWDIESRALMRRLDHCFIFILIAGTCTPICLISMPPASGYQLLLIIWIFASVGIVQSLVWSRAPKWLAALLYVFMGWIAAPYMNQLYISLGGPNLLNLILGGVIYTLGALVYAVKRPNPLPEIFGYHEIFHLLTIIAATFHFIVINRIITLE